MCSNCIGSGFLIPHDVAKCPFKSALHCSHCGTYGHTLATCSDRPAALYNKIAFVEQLIPLEQLEQYGITSRTPLPAAAASLPLSPFPSTKGCIEVVNDPKVIREFLVARGVKPRSKEMMTQLQEYAKKENRRLLLISRPLVEDAVTAADDASKDASKNA
jgi:hypothetical protein